MMCASSIIERQTGHWRCVTIDCNCSRIAVGEIVEEEKVKDDMLMYCIICYVLYQIREVSFFFFCYFVALWKEKGRCVVVVVVGA
jgi:hypothetical protein